MNWGILQKTVAACGVTSLLAASAALAGGASPLVQEQIQELIEQNRVLTERLRQLEQKVGTQPMAATDDGILQQINSRVNLSGLVEVEMNSGEDFAGVDESDLALATVEFGLGVEVSEWVTADLVLLWDDEKFSVDEGIITIGNTDTHPLYGVAGRMFVPFGSFESSMITGTLTEELGETNDTALLLGMELPAGVSAAFYLFNGDVNETGDQNENEIKNFGFSLGYGFENDTIALSLGVDWINSVAESGALEEHFTSTIQDYVEGLALHAVFSSGPFGVIIEHVSALDNFVASELAFRTTGAKPEAWNLEVSYTTELTGYETTFALGYQGTDEALALDWAEDRYIASVGVLIFENTALALEFMSEDDYSPADGGTGNDKETITMQLAVEF